MGTDDDKAVTCFNCGSPAETGAIWAGGEDRLRWWPPSPGKLRRLRGALNIYRDPLTGHWIGAHSSWCTPLHPVSRCLVLVLTFRSMRHVVDVRHRCPTTFARAARCGWAGWLGSLRGRRECGTAGLALPAGAAGTGA